MPVFLKILLGNKLGRYALAALALCVLIAGLGLMIRQEAFEDAEQATAEETVKAEQERKKDDARIEMLDDYALCQQYFDTGRMPNDCKQLRGLQKE